MKKSKKIIGIMGEEIACRYLRSKGYTILERNYTCRHGELDIIASIASILVIVEVKTRKDDKDLYACQSITPKKISNIMRASHDYMYKNGLYRQDYRYDAIEIYWKDKRIVHHEDAF